MNLNMAENTNKLILLVVAAVALLLTLNTYQKQIGKNLAVVLSIVTIVVVGFVGFNLMNGQPASNNNNVNSVNNVNLVPNVDQLVDEALANELNAEVNLNGNQNLVPENVVEGFQNGNNLGEDEPEEEDAAPEVNNNGGNNGNNAGNNGNNAGNNGNNAGNNGNNAGNNGNNPNNQAVSNNPVNSGAMLNCAELLPSGENTPWAQVSPSGVGDICTKNLLNAGHHIGVNTQGCSLRNANRGLRSEPPNPQVLVSPWSNSTICPDLHRRPLE